MCSIGGIIPLSNEVTKEHILSIVQFLLLENAHRGRDATGIATINIADKKVFKE